mmetsp:Transcript_86598/g.245152  ORF Transcript_86598/g.245152 Transcript_86598/m.245152 type:complete len:351 (+) Transcript_86598:3435-4487(+)
MYVLRGDADAGQLDLRPHLHALRLQAIESHCLQQGPVLALRRSPQQHVHLRALVGPQDHAGGRENEVFGVLNARLAVHLAVARLTLEAGLPATEGASFRKHPAAALVHAAVTTVHPRRRRDLSGLARHRLEGVAAATLRHGLREEVYHLLVRVQGEVCLRSGLQLRGRRRAGGCPGGSRENGWGLAAQVAQPEQHGQLAGVAQLQLPTLPRVCANDAVVEHAGAAQLYLRRADGPNDRHPQRRSGGGLLVVKRHGQLNHEMSVQIYLLQHPQRHAELHETARLDAALRRLDRRGRHRAVARQRGGLRALGGQRRPHRGQPLGVERPPFLQAGPVLRGPRRLLWLRAGLGR